MLSELVPDRRASSSCDAPRPRRKLVLPPPEQAVAVTSHFSHPGTHRRTSSLICRAPIRGASLADVATVLHPDTNPTGVTPRADRRFLAESAGFRSSDARRRNLLGLDPHIGQLQRYGGRIGQRAVAGTEQADPPASREHRARRPEHGPRSSERTAPSGRSPRARSRGVAGDHRHRRRRSGGASACRCPAGSSHAGIAMLFSPLRPCLSLADLDPLASEEIREREVVPHRVAGEVDEVRRVPAKAPAQARAAEERGPCIRARA